MAENNAIVTMFRYLWYGIDGIRKVLHLVLMLVLFAVIVAALPTDMPTAPTNAALVIPFDGFLVDELSGDAFDRAVAEFEGTPIRETLVRDVVAALDNARYDDGVPGVVLELGGLAGGGLTKAQAVADAVARFRESGKPVYAYSALYSQPAYLIAAHADEIWMDPHGGVFLAGYGSFRNYYRDAIDKLEIDWNVFRAGAYKSYGEPFTRNDMSAESREASLAWLDDLWADYLASVAEAREIDQDVLTGLADGLAGALAASDGDWAAVAVDAGLVDRLVNGPDKLASLAARFGDDDGQGGYNGVDFETYLAGTRLGEINAAAPTKVAVIVASGPVVDGEAPPGQIGGETISAMVRAARLDDDVAALVMRIDTGGGSVFAADQIQAELAAFMATGRPYVASMGSTAASAGYWLAASADTIYASPATITGSIGVVGMFPTFQRSLAKLGVHTDGVGTGSLAGQFRPDRSLSADARIIIQKLIDADYARFVGGVAEFRDMETTAVHEIAQGRVWSGVDALDIGLIDAFGEIDAAVAAAAELAELEAGSYDVDYVERPRSAFEDLLVQLAGTGARLGLSTRARQPMLLERAESWLTEQALWLSSFNDPKGSYSVCFCRVR